MKCYPLLFLAVVLFTSAIAICALTDEQQPKAAPAAQAQEFEEAPENEYKAYVAAKQESDFEKCEAMLIEFMHKYPKPTLTERIKGYYLVAQCQERLGQFEDAIFSYAKAVTVGGELAETATATKAKERLERLYKALHNNTLLGIDKVYKKAKESIENQKNKSSESGTGSGL